MPRDKQGLGERVASMISSDLSITLHQISASIKVDRHIIQRSIRRQYDLSFRELKKQIRLRQALTLLIDDQHDLLIKEIAYCIGITPNAFSRFIRSVTGHCAIDLQRSKK
jgi:methylphosphotriester-DNA--protein-cysteine methyltransferase